MEEITTPDYKIDENDPRLQAVKTDQETAMSEMDGIYDGQINANNSTLNSMKSDLEKSQAAQNKIVNQQTDLAIKQINQDKQQAHKDYIKEQSGAWVDYQKQVDPYGVNAEKMAAQGLDNSGYKESSMVSMYNQYQNRVAVAREGYNKALMNYNNKIAEAKLQNSSLLAEIAKETLAQQLELTVQFTQMNNTLLSQKAQMKATLSQNWWDRYQDVYSNIEKENALAEEVRQYNETLKEQKRQHDETLAFQREQFTYQKEQDALKYGKIEDKGDGPGGSSGKKGARAAGKDSSSIRESKSEKSGVKAGAKSAKNGNRGAYVYLNRLIASGATKDKVANEIAIALREGAITKEEAAKLRSKFTPRGVQY